MKAGPRSGRWAVSSLVVALLGCAGTLDPTQFSDPGGDGVCDAPTVVLTPSCGQASCHAGAAPASGLDLFSPGLVARLLDKRPDPTNSMHCATVPTPFLEPQSDPASGLLFDKLGAQVPCGVRMPVVGTLSPSDTACLREWATAVTTGVITP